MPDLGPPTERLDEFMRCGATFTLLTRTILTTPTSTAEDFRRMESLADLLGHWARHRTHESAYTFLNESAVAVDSLTYGQLYAAATAFAQVLSRSTRSGDRVLLMLPSGLTFIVAFLGCQFAGVVPVPIPSMRNKRVRDLAMSVARDSRPTLCIAPKEVAVQVGEDLRMIIPAIGVTALDGWKEIGAQSSTPQGEAHSKFSTAFIQYTSGSTSNPKGVVVTQQNVLANLSMQCQALQNRIGVVYVGWAPFYHDMGLIGNILEPLYVGGHSVLIAAGDIARDPTLWMKAISEYKAEVSGGPNYIYDLCIKAFGKIRLCNPDLSSWRVAFNSGEPVRPATVDGFVDRFAALGFRPEAMYPCYGLAEATLMVSGRDPRARTSIRNFGKTALGVGLVREPNEAKDECRLVGCGQPLAGETIAIVEPETGRRCPQGVVGEIWVAGPHIPTHYWESKAASLTTFQARLVESTSDRFLRTGDLGFFEAGELFIVGRLKDVVILRGRNLYPQDVEVLAEQSIPGARMNANAAFSVTASDGDERLVLVQEIERTQRRALDPATLRSAVRRTILAEFDVTLSDLVFVEPGSIPKTTSGKIRRSSTRLKYLSDQLEKIDLGVQRAEMS